MKFASSMVLDVNKGVLIDGIEFPFLVGLDIGIEPGGSDALTVVRLPVFVLGTVTYTDGKFRRVIDQELGDVGEWARQCVRSGLLDRIPWLRAAS